MDKRKLKESFLVGWGKRFKMECLICSKIFVITTALYNSGHGTYCSKKCSYQGQCKYHKHPRWKGGKIKRSGYWYINMPSHPFSGKQGYVAEHRLIMEAHLGRYLVHSEVVHHINHDKIDNRLSNLELCSSPGQHSLTHHPEALQKATLASVKANDRRRKSKTLVDF